MKLFRRLEMRSDTLSREKSEVLVNEFVRSVYNWMAVGLVLTGRCGLVRLQFRVNDPNDLRE